jgi:hypothetical protein
MIMTYNLPQFIGVLEMFEEVISKDLVTVDADEHRLYADASKHIQQLIMDMKQIHYNGMMKESK